MATKKARVSGSKKSRKVKRSSPVMAKTYESIKREAEKPIEKRKEIRSKRNQEVKVRKYHMSDTEIEKFRVQFEKEISDIPVSIRDMAGTRFFNPFRRSGIYYGCVQALYELGVNTWHSHPVVREKISEVLSQFLGVDKIDSWSRFASKSPRQREGSDTITAKDIDGRIIQNMRVLQRLGGLHPYGYKLKQVCSCINIKKEEEDGGGVWYYQLQTDFDKPEDVNPVCQTGKKRGRQKKEKLEVAAKIVPPKKSSAVSTKKKVAAPKSSKKKATKRSSSSSSSKKQVKKK